MSNLNLNLNFEIYLFQIHSISLNEKYMNPLLLTKDTLFNFIKNNLEYFYLFLIFIISIILIILLFYLASSKNKIVTSVKMNNLPENENSKKRKRKSSNENENTNPEDGSSPNLKIFSLDEDEEKASYKYYIEKYNNSIEEKRIKPRSTSKEIIDCYPILYSKYKKYKKENPELDFKKLTDIFLCTWDKHPGGYHRYKDTESEFNRIINSRINRINLINKYSLTKASTLNFSLE